MQSVGDFLKVLPGLLVGKTELRVLFISYRDIGDYEDCDTVDTGKPGLKIFINISEAGSLGHDSVLNNSDQLIVVYAGISGFQEFFDYACVLKRDFPQATVVVLTCDCHIARKEKILDDSIVAREIDYAVYTENCGGRRSMSDILKMLIFLWPQAK